MTSERPPKRERSALPVLLHRPSDRVVVLIVGNILVTTTYNLVHMAEDCGIERCCVFYLSLLMWAYEAVLLTGPLKGRE